MNFFRYVLGFPSRGFPGQPPPAGQILEDDTIDRLLMPFGISGIFKEGILVFEHAFGAVAWRSRDPGRPDAEGCFLAAVG